jgi:hypothetical protein
VPTGSYYLGIWYESSTDGLEAPQQYNGRLRVYLNGRAVQLSTHSDPIQVSPGVYYVEAQSQAAEPLTDGDALLAYDPSRWILYDGDGDLHGLWDTLAEHYMIPYKGEQHSSYLPDSRFWRDLDHDLVPSEARSGYNKQMVYRSDLKAIMNTENAWKVDGLQSPGLSVVAGEDDVLSPAIDSGRGAIVWYWKQNVDGHRDLGASIVCNYTTITGLNRRAHNLQCFIMPEHVHHGFAGRPFQAR